MVEYMDIEDTQCYVGQGLYSACKVCFDWIENYIELGYFASF